MDDPTKDQVIARIRTALVLYVFGALGLFLLAVPWTPVWDEVTAVLLPQALADWTATGWARGAVSGLGALDLVAAARDARALWRGLRPREEGS